MRFEWDEEKEQLNIRKHGIDFDTASTIFEDPHQLTRPDWSESGDDRWQTLGTVEGALLLLLVIHKVRFEDDEEFVRIISARRAEPFERRAYGNGCF